MFASTQLSTSFDKTDLASCDADTLTVPSGCTDGTAPEQNDQARRA